MRNFDIVCKNRFFPKYLLVNLALVQINVKVIRAVVDSGWNYVTYVDGKAAAGHFVAPHGAGGSEGDQSLAKAKFCFQRLGPRWVRLDIIIPVDIGFGLRNSYVDRGSRNIGRNGRQVFDHIWRAVDKGGRKVLASMST